MNPGEEIPQQKVCPQCKITKPLTAYYKCHGRTLGVQHVCIPCFKVYQPQQQAAQRFRETHKRFRFHDGRRVWVKRVTA